MNVYVYIVCTFVCGRIHGMHLNDARIVRISGLRIYYTHTIILVEYDNPRGSTPIYTSYTLIITYTSMHVIRVYKLKKLEFLNCFQVIIINSL